jgi:hypothetical protein
MLPGEERWCAQQYHDSHNQEGSSFEVFPDKGGGQCFEQAVNDKRKQETTNSDNHLDSHDDSLDSTS